MTKKLLIEIGVEELPAVPLLKIIDKIENSWREILSEYRLSGEFEFLYTPRRLVILQEAIETAQADSVEELFGPPLDVAVRDSQVTKAGEGFARKCGVSFEELSTIEKGGRKILYYKKEIEGKDSVELLPEMVTKWVSSMNFGKMMRWGDSREEFIRPVRWLQVRLGDESVEMSLFGVRSGTATYLHRVVDMEPVEVESIERYEDILSKGMVELRPSRRRDRILEGIEAIEEKMGVVVERDEELLAEIVAITEHPTPLYGSFDDHFLQLPPEVIVTSMKEHQRYFPVFDRDGNLVNGFVVVGNAVSDDLSKVVSGNERVLRPRLSDALFFYQNDLSRGLGIEGLEKIRFIDGLGTLKDKVDRERNIALRLAGIYMDTLESECGKDAMEIERLVERAVTLAKADLLSEMVYEFTELQGLMGYYYAKALGEDPLVCMAIKEQYMPVGEGAELPGSVFSSILSLSIKLDTLMGLFSVGMIPSGSKDPFALRRAVNGIVRIVVEHDLSFDIETVTNLLKDQYEPFDLKRLEEFIIERIYKAFDANTSVISAVLASGERDINEIYKKVKALDSIVSGENSRELFTTFKRVANISGDVDPDSDLNVNPALFEDPREGELYDRFREVVSTEYKDYEERLRALFGLKKPLDDFFDNVLVNTDDPDRRKNRRDLIASIYRAFKSIADIKEISV